MQLHTGCGSQSSELEFIVMIVLQDNVKQVEQLISQQIQESDSSNGITKGLMNGPAAVWA